MATPNAQQPTGHISEITNVTEGLLRSGQISKSAAAKIFAALGVQPESQRTQNSSAPSEDFLSWAVAAFAGIFTGLGASLRGVFIAKQNRPHAAPLARAKGVTGSDSVTRPVVGGIDALLSFETLAATLKPLFNEYVWWFIAMVLVISGSIMGIREAWLRFEGILRPLTILFAFFTYHTLFLGLGIFLFRKSMATGRMLVILAAALIPLMFSISDSITRQAQETGAVATGTSFILALVTLLPIARRIGIPYFSAVCYLPLPFALAALAGLTTTLPWLSLVLIPALAASIIAATGAQDDKAPVPKFIFMLIGITILFICLTAFNLGSDDDLARALRQLAIMAVLAQFAFTLRTLDLSRARFFSALEIVTYAVIALMAIAGARTFSTGSATLLPFSFAILTYPLAIVVFLRATIHHNAAIHPLIFMVMMLGYHMARLITIEPAWQIFAFFIFPLAIPWFASSFHENKKKIFLYWATIAGILASCAEWVSPPHIAAATIGLLTAVTIHRGAGFERSAFHYLSPIGLMVFIGRLPILQDSRLQAFEVFSLLALLYALGGWYFEKKARAAGDKDGYPIDDLSLISAGIALLALSAFQPVADENLVLNLGIRIIFVRPLIWLVAIWLFLQLRALRDRSVLISLFAHLGATLIIFQRLQLRDYAEAAAFFVLLATGFYAATQIFQKGGTIPKPNYGRIFLLRLRLPFNTGGVNNIGYASALATLFLMGMAFMTAANWISDPDFSHRSLMLIAQIGLLILTACMFHFKTFSIMHLRGSLVLLFVLLFAIAFTAVINRIGRPLPIDVVGFKLLLLFPVMALVTAVLKVYGPHYGKYLNSEKQGIWYYTVPVTGVIGLTLLLVYDGLIVSAADFDRAFYFVPPTIFLALALYPLILAHTISVHARHAFYFFIPLFLAAVLGERSFLGPDLSLINTMFFNEGYSYLAFRQNIVIGFASGVLALSILAFVSRRSGSAVLVTNTLLSKNSAGVSNESGIWSLVFTGFIALMSFQVAAIPPGLILFVVVFFYLFAGNIRAAAFILFLAGLLVIHGGAHLTAIYPIWPGPVLVIAALAMLYPAKKIAAKLDLAESFVAETTLVAGGLYVVAAFFYAATEGRPANALQAGLSVLTANVQYLATGGFYQSPALVLTFFLTALFFWLAIHRIEGRSRTAFALLGHFSVSATLATTAWLCLTRMGNVITFMTAAPYAMVAILLLEIAMTMRLNQIKAKDLDVYAGNFTARDAVIIFCGLLFIPISQNPANPLPQSGFFTLTSLILYLVVNIQAAFTSSKTRYVYIAQATIAGLYYSARPMLGITNPAVDAFFAFGYAFALLGVSIAAERFGATVVSEPTRRFAAIMPVAVALILDNFRSLSAALYAVIASGLYFSLSRLGERNLFAALAAITLNAALFFVALAQGFDTSEFYAFPLGLTIIFFATVFKSSLSADNQARVRTIGGLIAYLPAAMHVTMRSGLAQNPTYSLVFGLICIVSIMAGSIFHIRSYLFLGVLFFTLDIVANLVQEGLQNQFIGFVLLTLTGLGLIAALIIFNLKKEAILTMVGRLRNKFARWD